MKPKVFIGQETYKSILDIVTSNPNETGFYLIGSYVESLSTYFVFDAIEYRYIEQTRTNIISDPTQKNLLYQSLPGGSEIIGNLHSHPFAESVENLRPSMTDILTYNSYNHGIFGLANNSGRIIFFLYRNKNINDLNYRVIPDDTFFDFFDIEKIEDIWVIIPKKLSDWEKKSYIHDSIVKRKTLYYSLSKIVLDNSKPSLVKPNWIDVLKIQKKFRIPYRIFFHNIDSVAKTIEIIFGTKNLYTEGQKSIDPKDLYLLKNSEIFINTTP